MIDRLTPLLLLTGLALLPCQARAEATNARSWCAPELVALPRSVCASTDSDRQHASLVVFLHGVIKPDTRWQHAQQRALARAAKQNGFDVVMPRGRQGIGPPGMRDWWTWPTSARAQEQLGAELLGEWRETRRLLEQRRGSSYQQLFVFGFSNGAYYASQLTLQGQIPGHGTAVFAGGSSGSWLGQSARSVHSKVPMYVECGGRDKAAKDDAFKLQRLLKQLGWPHRYVERPRIGHSMADAGLKAAFEYLTRQVTP